MSFLPYDFETDTWKRVQKHLEQLRAEDRRVLEGQALDEKPTQTVRLRARIGLLTTLLNLPEAARKAAEERSGDT